MKRQRCEIWTLGYTISKKGIIKNKHGKIIKYRDKSNSGYIRVGIRINKKLKRFFIHRLLAEKFIPNQKNKPCVNHKDGNKLNNNINNLEWCTYSENTKHSLKNKLWKPNTTAMIQHNKKYGVWNKGLHTGNQYT